MPRWSLCPCIVFVPLEPQARAPPSAVRLSGVFLFRTASRGVTRGLLRPSPACLRSSRVVGGVGAASRVGLSPRLLRGPRGVCRGGGPGCPGRSCREHLWVVPFPPDTHLRGDGGSPTAPCWAARHCVLFPTAPAPSCRVPPAPPPQGSGFSTSSPSSYVSLQRLFPRTPAPGCRPDAHLPAPGPCPAALTSCGSSRLGL